MTVESKINFRAIDPKGGEDRFSMSDHFHPTKGISYPDSHYFTEPQAKIFEHLSPLLDLDYDTSFKLLTDCCLSIARGDGSFLNDRFVHTPCKDDLIKALEGIYAKNIEKKGLYYAIEQFGLIKKVKKLLKNKKVEALLQRVMAEDIMASHSFVETGLMSLLANARRNQVVPSVDFMWLKAEDRNLWYSLQSVGRKVGFAEAYMAKNVWDMEVSLNRPLLDVVG